MAAFKCCALALVSFWRSSSEEAPVLAVMAAESSLYLVNSASISSATLGNGAFAFRAQKKSLDARSNPFFVLPVDVDGLLSSSGDSITTPA